jgi:hypothetical protein
MTYDTLLATRIRAALGPLPHLEEKKMFGGVGILIDGNTLAPAASAGVACGVHKDELIVGVGPENSDLALSLPHTHAFEMTGRPMAGWVMIKPQGCATEPQLKAWVDQGLAFASSLPSKEKLNEKRNH